MSMMRLNYIYIYQKILKQKGVNIGYRTRGRWTRGRRTQGRRRKMGWTRGWQTPTGWTRGRQPFSLLCFTHTVDQV